MERTKNALLFVIALCLVLIVLRLYSSCDFVSVAQAQQGTEGVVYGCYYQTQGANCTPKPVRVDKNGILYTIQ